MAQAVHHQDGGADEDRHRVDCYDALEEIAEVRMLIFVPIDDGHEQRDYYERL